MKTNRFLKTILILSLLCVFSFYVNSFAGMSRGPDTMSGSKGHGHFKHIKGVSEEEREQIMVEKRAFHEATENIRQDIFEKKMELLGVLAQKDMNIDRARKLQADISSLQGDIDQKKIDHYINIKQISPNAARHFMKKLFMKNHHKGKNGHPLKMRGKHNRMRD